WLSLRYHGKAAFRGSIAQDLALAQRLAENIRRSPDLELLAPVELSAVCFRVIRGRTSVETGLAPSQAGQDSDAQLNDLNRAILGEVIRRGRVYLSNAALASSGMDNRFALRACIVNHRTTPADVDAVLAEVRAAAGE